MRGLRRHLAASVIPLRFRGAVGTSRLGAWVADLIFTGLAAALVAGRSGLRALAGPVSLKTSQERRST
jgi:hypothetical protein